MKPRITVIIIGVDDLEKSLRFYRDGLGLETEGIIGTEFEYGAVAFFDLQGGLRLAIWPRESIAHASGIAVGPSSPTEFTLGHNVSSKAEVDEVMRQASKAGAVVVKDTHDTFGEATLATSRTRTATCGRSSGTPHGKPAVRDVRPVWAA
jgi:uncharacterized protein